jgi:hypothetical protein
LTKARKSASSAAHERSHGETTTWIASAPAVTLRTKPAEIVITSRITSFLRKNV